MKKTHNKLEDHTTNNTKETQLVNHRKKYRFPFNFFHKLNLLNLVNIKNLFNNFKPSVQLKALPQEIIFTNFQEFRDKTVEDVMIPRSDIVAVKSSINLNDLNQIIIKFSHTRTLVYNDTLDNIIGFLHIKDLFKTLARAENYNLRKLIRKPIIAAPSMKIVDLLSEMQKKRTHIAIVVDEYGGTDGMVTIEDIMEEMFGRIDDEHDEQLESDSYKIVNSTTILSNSRVEVEDLEKILGVQLKQENDEFDTIGGLVLAKVGRVPITGTKINISENVELEVIDANPRTLKLVRLKLKNGQLLAS